MEKKILSLSEFYKSLRDSNKTEVSFNNRLIKDSFIIPDSHFNRNLQNLDFLECEFKGIIFFESIEKSSLSILFDSCSFEKSFKIDNSSLNRLRIFDTKKIGNSFNISGNIISAIYLKNRDELYENKLSGNIRISANTFKNKVDLENLNHTSQSFKFIGNILETKERFGPNDDLNASFANTKLHNADFSETNFGEEIGFDGMILQGGQDMYSFNDCTFGKAYFNNVDFGACAFFNGSVFNGNITLNRCQNIENTIVDFSGCEISKRFYLVYSEFNHLIIKNTTFEKQVSFQNSEFNKVTFENLSFEKQAFFDDIEIKNVKDCDRKSLRTIKYQLQKTDNRIDYNKFKAYEIEAYRKELEKGQWKDRFILWLNHHSSRHGLDWVRSAMLTLIVGLITYSFYYTLEHSNTNYILDLNEGVNHFFIGYFDFLVPSYKSPFKYGLKNGWLYFPFLLGKIVIAYGIYQTIVSFRKFRL